MRRMRPPSRERCHGATRDRGGTVPNSTQDRKSGHLAQSPRCNRIWCVFMGTERLAVEFEREAGGSVMLRVSGRLERATAALLDGVLRALRTDLAPVTVDLTDVDHIDSHGLEVL